MATSTELEDVETPSNPLEHIAQSLKTHCGLELPDELPDDEDQFAHLVEVAARNFANQKRETKRKSAANGDVLQMSLRGRSGTAEDRRATQAARNFHRMVYGQGYQG